MNDVIADLKENHASPVSPQKNPCTYNLTSISQWRCISGCILFVLPYCFPLINCCFTPTYPNIPVERKGHDAEPEYPILNKSHRNSWKTPLEANRQNLQVTLIDYHLKKNLKINPPKGGNTTCGGCKGPHRGQDHHLPTSKPPNHFTDSLRSVHPFFDGPFL